MQLTAYTALSMSNGLDIGQWAAGQTLADAHKIQGTSAGPNFTYRGIYRGDFVTFGGQAQSGTIGSYEAYKLDGGYKVQYELAGMNMTLTQFLNAKATHLGEDFTSYLLRGSDTIKGSSSSDKLYSWGGNDTISGYSGNDRLYGGTGNDKLNGGIGNDIFSGGSGKDTLTGSTGADIFDFNSASEAGTSSSTRDTITDFLRGSDRIDLSGIDANSKASGNNSFTKLLSSSSFTAPGQLKFVGGVLYGNTDSDSASEFSINLTGISKLSLSDIIL